MGLLFMHLFYFEDVGNKQARLSCRLSGCSHKILEYCVCLDIILESGLLY